MLLVYGTIPHDCIFADNCVSPQFHAPDPEGNDGYRSSDMARPCTKTKDIFLLSLLLVSYLHSTICNFVPTVRS